MESQKGRMENASFFSIFRTKKWGIVDRWCGNSQDESWLKSENELHECIDDKISDSKQKKKTAKEIKC